MTTAKQNEPVVPVDVIICIYVPTAETLELVRHCIASVLARTSYPYRLILVDDCSPYPGVPEMMRSFRRAHPNQDIVELRNEKNQGFVLTANRAMTYGPQRDVVLLNNDTEVSTGWLTRLVSAGAADASGSAANRIATVTPLSNNATFASVPVVGRHNEFPPGFTVEDVARVVLRHSPGTRPEVPTAHGFCMYIKRAALNAVGLFDEKSFNTGYGEENDLCCRLSERGWIHVVDDLTYVWHKGEASFQGSRDHVTHQHFKKLIALHPWFYERIKEFEETDPLSEHRAAIGRALQRPRVPSVDLESNTRAPRLNVLSVNFRAGKYNGLVRFTHDLSEELADRVDTFVLESDGKELSLGLHASTVQWTYILPERLNWTRFSGNMAYRRIVEDWIDRLGVDVVQINTLEGHTVDIIDIAHARDIPVVMVVHDFAVVCPTKYLLDPNFHFCGVCDCGNERVGCLEQNPSLGSAPGSATLLHDYRQVIRRDVLPKLSAIVAPSTSAAELLTKQYPELVNRVEVIEHGLELPAPVSMLARSAVSSIETKRLHVAFLGSLHLLKGLPEARAVIETCDPKRFQFTLLGQCNEQVDGLNVLGAYDFRTVVERLRSLKVDVVMLLSRAYETFGYTLSEAAGAGLPVVVHDVGALASRVRTANLGWVVDAQNTAQIVQLLNHLRDNPEVLEEARRSVAARQQPTRAGMGASYWSLFAPMAPTQERITRHGTELMFALRSYGPSLEVAELKAALARSEAAHRQLQDKLVVKMVEQLKKNRTAQAVMNRLRSPLSKLVRPW